MAKISDWVDGAGGDTGAQIKTKIREGIVDVEKDVSLKGDGNVSTELGINSSPVRTGSTLVFDAMQGSFYNAAAPSNAASITLDPTGALVGAVCAFYNDGTVEPSVSPTPNPAAGTWVSGEVNVYWFMWDGTNFTQNIQAKAAVVLPTLSDPTYTLAAGSALELDYTFDTVDANATGGVFQISTDATFATGTESVVGYSFGVNGTITEYASAPLTAITYYTRLQSTASGYNSSAFVEESATATAVPTLTTPTIVVTAGDTQNSIDRTVEDAAATGGVLEWSLDGATGWTPVPEFVFAVTPTVHLSLTNGVEIFYRYNSTAGGYNDSALATGSGTPDNLPVAIPFTVGADISPSGEVYTCVANTTERWGYSTTSYSGDFDIEILMEDNSNDENDAKNSIGLTTAQTNREYSDGVASWVAGLNVQSTDQVRFIENSITAVGTGHNYTWGVGNKLRLKRVSDNVKGYMDIGGSLTEVYDFGTIAGTLFVQFTINPTPNLPNYSARNIRVTV